MYKIAIVGEAWGEIEAREKTAFVGPAGYALTKMLEEAGIKKIDCYLTNVFNLRPSNNDIETLCGTKDEVTNDLPFFRRGKYFLDQYTSEIARLGEELSYIKPNLVIAAGATASWALLGNAYISKVRGTVAQAHGPAPYVGKVLPIYHPAAILRQWELRHVTIMDLLKARRESEYPEIRRPFRKVFIEPTLEDLDWFMVNYLQNAERISFDIETDPGAGVITCVGFAPSPKIAIVVPLCKGKLAASGSYWPTLDMELSAIKWIHSALSLPASYCGQNGIYDMSWLWAKYKLPVPRYRDDSMIMHHAIYPEVEKGLGFLGSVYTNEASWKLLNRSQKGDEE